MDVSQFGQESWHEHRSLAQSSGMANAHGANGFVRIQQSILKNRHSRLWVGQFGRTRLFWRPGSRGSTSSGRPQLCLRNMSRLLRVFSSAGARSIDQGITGGICSQIAVFTVAGNRIIRAGSEGSRISPSVTRRCRERDGFTHDTGGASGQANGVCAKENTAFYKFEQPKRGQVYGCGREIRKKRSYLVYGHGKPGDFSFRGSLQQRSGRYVGVGRARAIQSGNPPDHRRDPLQRSDPRRPETPSHWFRPNEDGDRVAQSTLPGRAPMLGSEKAIERTMRLTCKPYSCASLCVSIMADVGRDLACANAAVLGFRVIVFFFFLNLDLTTVPQLLERVVLRR